MPVFRMYKSSNYSNIGANQPNRAGTLNIGSFRGKGSYSRMFTQCKQNSANPSGCINQFIAFTPKPKPKPKPPTPPPPPPPDTNGNILFDISSFSKKFNSVTGYPQTVFPDTTVPSLYQPLDSKALDALTRAAKRWAHFLSFTPEYVNLMGTFIKDWKGITLDRFLITNKIPDTGESIEKYLAFSSPNVKFSQTSFIVGANMYVNEYYFKMYDENQYFHILSHELGHILGFPCMTVKDNDRMEVLPNIHIFEGDKFYDSNYFTCAARAYKKKYKGITVETRYKSGQCNDDGPNVSLIPLFKPKYDHWSPNTKTYKIKPNNDNPDDECSYQPPSNATDYVTYHGLYNELMVPYWNAGVDKNSHYLITDITLGALTSLYTPWKNGYISNYKLLQDSGTSYDQDCSLSAGEDVDFFKRSDKSIQFKGNVWEPPKNKEIKIKDEEEYEEEDESLFKETITHKCRVCKPIYLDACGDCI